MANPRDIAPADVFRDTSVSEWIAVYANLVGRKRLLRNPGQHTCEMVIQGIRAGLPVKSFDRVKDMLGVNQAELCRVVDIAPRTLARRRVLKPGESERLFRISALFEKAMGVLGGREEAQRWFRSPKKALGGRSPFDYAESELGAREVEDLLGRIEHGVFS